MTEEPVRQIYQFTDVSIEAFKKWMANGYLHHLVGVELRLFNIAIIPVLTYLCLLLMSCIPNVSFDDSPVVWYFAWGYLCLSVALFVFMHLKSPRSLLDEANDLMEKEFSKMVFDAHVKSEIEELTSGE
jgi:hypothetical protein